MSQLSLGVIPYSGKKHEKRVPLHPAHLPYIDGAIRGRMFVEHGYGNLFGFSDNDLAPHVAGSLSRSELIRRCDAILLFKVTPTDVRDMREGQILIGAPHFAQNMETTQLAIDRKLTVISMEAMRHWPQDGTRDRFVFHRVSELAGYCSVQHAMQTTGRTGHWGRPLKAAIIGFGSTGQGAAAALRAQGVSDVSILTRRPSAEVAPPFQDARMMQLHYNPADPAASTVTGAGQDKTLLAEFLAGHDIVVNCVLQDIDAPQVYLTDQDIPRFPAGALLVDVSCDKAMSFGWAHPTSFDEPTITVGNGVRYYAVDHSPSLLWETSTWELSHALLPFLPIMADRRSWSSDPTVRQAVEMRDGVILNPSIISYQGRSPHYPHTVRRTVEGLPIS